MKSWLARILKTEPHELPALLWAFFYFFCLLCSYYILRPVRDEMGIQGGVDKLQWLFSATFVAMLVAVPFFGFYPPALHGSVSSHSFTIFSQPIYWYFLY